MPPSRVIGTEAATESGLPCRQGPGSTLQRGTTRPSVHCPLIQTYVFESNAGADPQIWSSPLGSLREARIEAVKTLGELLRDDGSQFWDTRAVSMTVSDQDGHTLFRLDLSAAQPTDYDKPND